MSAAIHKPVHYPEYGDASPQAPASTANNPKKITLNKAYGTRGFGIVIRNQSATVDLRLSFSGGNSYLLIPPNTVIKFDASFLYFYVQSNSAAAIDWSAIVLQD